MPAAIAIPLISAAASGTAAIVGAKMSSGAAKDAANTSTAAANHAADLQSQSAKDALAFQQSEASRDQANFNSTQKANYNQWRPREEQLSALGQLVGLPARNIPAYEQTANSGGQPTSGTPSPIGNDPVTQAIADNYKALGVQPTGPGTGPTDIEYMVKQAKASLAAGERPLSYWLGPDGRIAQELQKSSGGGVTAAPKTGTTNSLASYISPMMAPPAPTLQLPSVQYGRPAAPGSLAALIGRN